MSLANPISLRIIGLELSVCISDDYPVKHRNICMLQMSSTVDGSSKDSSRYAFPTDSPRAQAQVQQQMPAESLSLQNEIQSLGKQVEQTEQSMLEIASLNQMFSAQVMQQSEMTQQLYDQVSISFCKHLKWPFLCTWQPSNCIGPLNRMSSHLFVMLAWFTIVSQEIYDTTTYSRQVESWRSLILETKRGTERESICKPVHGALLCQNLSYCPSAPYCMRQGALLKWPVGSWNQPQMCMRQTCCNCKDKFYML